MSWASALFFALFIIHMMCSGLSPSTAASPKGFSSAHANKRAHSMQCSGWRGMEAIVHNGKFTKKHTVVIGQFKSAYQGIPTLNQR